MKFTMLGYSYSILLSSYSLFSHLGAFTVPCRQYFFIQGSSLLLPFLWVISTEVTVQHRSSFLQQLQTIVDQWLTGTSVPQMPQINNARVRI